MKRAIISILVTIVALGGIIYFGYQSSWWQNPSPTAVVPEAEVKTPIVEAAGTKIVSQQNKEEKDFNNKTYQQLVVEYKGRRFQIQDCTSTPNQVTFKSGTTIMLDGFSADPQKITIGSQSVVLNGYDVSFMTLKSTKLPTTLTIDCLWLDQPQYNIATILLQA